MFRIIVTIIVYLGFLHKKYSILIVLFAFLTYFKDPTIKILQSRHPLLHYNIVTFLEHEI